MILKFDIDSFVLSTKIKTINSKCAKNYTFEHNFLIELLIFYIKQNNEIFLFNSTEKTKRKQKYGTKVVIQKDCSKYFQL